MNPCLGLRTIVLSLRGPDGEYTCHCRIGHGGPEKPLVWIIPLLDQQSNCKKGWSKPNGAVAKTTHEYQAIYKRKENRSRGDDIIEFLLAGELLTLGLENSKNIPKKVLYMNSNAPREHVNRERKWEGKNGKPIDKAKLVRIDWPTPITVINLS